MNIATYNITHDPKVEATNDGGFKTIQGTGTQVFIQYGENEKGIQEFKRVLDSNENTIGEYKMLDKVGYVHDKEYTDLIEWMGGINETVGCDVF
jgi:hypothetical protein